MKKQITPRDIRSTFFFIKKETHSLSLSFLCQVNEHTESSFHSRPILDYWDDVWPWKITKKQLAFHFKENKKKKEPEEYADSKWEKSTTNWILRKSITGNLAKNNNDDDDVVSRHENFLLSFFSRFHFHFVAYDIKVLIPLNVIEDVERKKEKNWESNHMSLFIRSNSQFIDDCSNETFSIG